MTKLPKKFVKENLQKAKRAMIFGVPIEALSRDELLACAIAGWDAERRAREEGLRRVKFMAELRSL